MGIDIPTYPTALGRVRIMNNIARKPSNIIMRLRDDDGVEKDVNIVARVGLPSQQRKAQLAGIYNAVNSLEVYVAMHDGVRDPKAYLDTLIINGTEYDIIDVQTMDGDRCFNLSVNKL